MRNASILILVYLCITLASEACAAPQFEYQVVFDNKAYKYAVTQANCPTSQWKKDAEPQISIGVAVNRAREEARRAYALVIDRKVARVEFRNLSSGDEYWFYCITFHTPEDVSGAGLSVPIHIVVFMDGSVLKPDSIEPANQNSRNWRDR